MTVTVLAAGAFLACSVSPAAQNALAATSMVQAEDVPALRLEVSLSARELYVFMAGEIVDAYPVAVGQPGHRTPTGTWEVFRIDWNPDWTPPDSPWAEEREYKPPGHPANPMGRVRMVFNPPYTVHGTEEYDSLGRAASHGSIRMGNDDIIELAPLVMKHGGEPRAEAWVEEVLAQQTEMRRIHLPEPVRIDVIP
jgi:lipoprotein-anchoring transpeptidase ErfK/SrfK